MTRVLFCVIPEKGHVNPYIGPAQALAASGAEVLFHAAADISEQLAAAGLLSFVGARERPKETHRGEAFAERVRDGEWLRGWIEALLVDAAAADVEPMRELLRRTRPDVVAIDPMVYAAAIACELEGLPWAAISNSLNPVLPEEVDSELLRTVRWLAPAREDLFARHGISARFRGCDVVSPHLTVAFATDAFVPPTAGVELVGPSLPRGERGDEVTFPWSRLAADRPIVYASFGSQIYWQPRLFRRLVDAIAGRPVQLVASASDLACSDAIGPLPANALFVPYVPQLALLRRASVMVTHGGANSVMEAIACGVPLLVAPLCNDQHHQRWFIERAGIGRALDVERGDAQSDWDAIAALLDANGSERLRMREVSLSYARDGAGETARLLIELAARSRRARGS